MKRRSPDQRSDASRASKTAKPNGFVSVRSSSLGPSPLEWFLGGNVTTSEFFRDYFERKPLVVRARDAADRQRSSALFNYTSMMKVLRSRELQFGDAMRVCKYHQGRRRDAHLSGRAEAQLVDDYFSHKKHTVQFFQPQRYSDPLWAIVSGLEDQFGALVGCSAYLTPPNTQGLAPHWDDVEVFIIQTEGEKDWDIWRPRQGEDLPEEPSGDLDASAGGRELFKKITLRPGDRLYFPRGWPHRARTRQNSQSCHVTISTYQRQAWAHFLGAIAPRLLSAAFEADLKYRRGMPPKYLTTTGTAFATSDVDQGVSLATDAKSMFKGLAKFVTPELIRKTCDEMAVDFVRSRMPPPPPPPPGDAKAEKISVRAGKISPAASNARFRLRDANKVRVVLEGGAAVVMHCYGNSRERHMGAPDAEEDESSYQDEDCLEDDAEKLSDAEKIPDEKCVESADGSEDEEEQDEGFGSEGEGVPAHSDLVFPGEMGQALALLVQSWPNSIDIKSIRQRLGESAPPVHSLVPMLVRMWNEGLLVTV